MKSKKVFNGMTYRQVQRYNSENRNKLQPAEIQLLKNNGYKNVGWEKIIQLHEKIQDIASSPYQQNWSISELFVEADRIGNKYQSVEDISTFGQKLSKFIQEIDDETEKYFPDMEAEIIDFSRR
jgi:hypothetical protein